MMSGDSWNETKQGRWGKMKEEKAYEVNSPGRAS
jgi:hypothetical protein